MTVDPSISPVDLAIACGTSELLLLDTLWPIGFARQFSVASRAIPEGWAGNGLGKPYGVYLELDGPRLPRAEAGILVARVQSVEDLGDWAVIFTSHYGRRPPYEADPDPIGLELAGTSMWIGLADDARYCASVHQLDQAIGIGNVVRDTGSTAGGLAPQFIEQLILECAANTDRFAVAVAGPTGLDRVFGPLGFVELDELFIELLPSDRVVPLLGPSD